jgi:hypothetical protein
VVKRTFLGKPLVTTKLRSEKLSNPIALGTVAPDPISSSCYGTEQILLELVPAAGMAAFVLLLPVTGVILLVLALVAASYRQVVMAYTQAGGSYVVARENFGPRVAQVAAAALLIDYVVTVAVQTAAGTVAVVSAIPVLGPFSLEITVGVVILICYTNLRGVREAGRPFAVATYSFVAMTTLTIVAGVVRHLFSGGLPTYDPRSIAGAIPVHHGSGLVMGATILVVLRAFANGGSSLTGVEAISNAANVFREPQGVNAQRVITAMACILGFLLAGVGYLAYATHATPYRDGYPSVLSQEARAVFAHGLIGQVMFVLVQASSAARLHRNPQWAADAHQASHHQTGHIPPDRYLYTAWQRVPCKHLSLARRETLRDRKLRLGGLDSRPIGAVITSSSGIATGGHRCRPNTVLPERITPNQRGIQDTPGVAGAFSANSGNRPGPSPSPPRSTSATRDPTS